MFRLLFCIFTSYFMYRYSTLKNMSNHHAAFWSDSPSTDERRYRITHHTRTERRGNRQEPQERQQRQQQQEQQHGQVDWGQQGDHAR